MRFYALIFGLCISVSAPCLAQTFPSTDIYLMDIRFEEGTFVVRNPKKITENPGYDNQPFFMPDGKTLLYVSIKEDKQADVYTYDLDKGTSSQLTHTEEDEYSPALVPDGKHISVVRVEEDSTQRLWQFSKAGADPRVLLPEVKEIGYYCWVNANKLGLFVLGDTFSLQLADLRAGTAKVIAKNIGRSVQKVPGEESISFVDKSDSTNWLIRKYDIHTGEITTLANCLSGSEDYAITGHGYILMGGGDGLYCYKPDNTKYWKKVRGLDDEALKKFYRLAISADGRKLALVTYTGQKP